MRKAEKIAGIAEKINRRGREFGLEIMETLDSYG